MGIPYESHHLIFTREEAGPIIKGTLLSLIEIAPTSSGTTSLNIDFVTEGKGVLHGSSGNLSIRGTGISIEKTAELGNNNSLKLERVLGGGKLERLKLDYPPYNTTEKGFEKAVEILKVLQANLPTFRDMGYDIDPVSFKIIHCLVKIPDAYPGFFCRSYGAKIKVSTEDLVKGKPERKLVLQYTRDMAQSREVSAYRRFLNSIK